MHVIALANQKGGVGKTTTTLGLAAALAHMGRQVTVVDFDPQISATSVFYPDDDDLESLPSIDDLLDQPESGLAAAAVPTDWGFTFVPGAESLAGRETSPKVGDERLLRRVFQLSEPDDAEYVLIDCPPSLALLTMSALIAADHLLLITHSTYFSLKGIRLFEKNLQRIYDLELNTRLKFAGVIANGVPGKDRDPEGTDTRSRGRTIEQADHLAELESHFGERLWEPYIPRTVVAETMASQGRPPHKLRGRGASAAALIDAYDQLAARLHETITESA